MKTPEVIYVAGYGRSGSTVLDILLGSAAGVESVGELFYLHREWNRSECRCTCGRDYARCAFWPKVREIVGGRFDDLSEESWERALRSVETLASLPFLATGLLPSARRDDYGRRIRAQLDGIAEAAPCDAIVDSSKSAWPAAGRALAMYRAGIRIRVIHLVRDVRAVCWSHQRDVLRASGSESDTDAPPHLGRLVRTAFGWTVANLAARLTEEILPRGSVLRIRYEDLVTRPRDTLMRVGAFLGHDLGAVADAIEQDRPLHSGHNTGGNRMRIQGEVRLRADLEWQRRLDAGARRLVTFVTWPLLLRFGYLGTRRGDDSSPRR